MPKRPRTSTGNRDPPGNAKNYVALLKQNVSRINYLGALLNIVTYFPQYVICVAPHMVYLGKG